MLSLKSPREIKLMRQAGRITAKTLLLVQSLIQPGVTTKFLEEEAEKYIRSQKAIPAFKGYRGFPACICASINEEIVHGIPSKRKLCEGDIISVDIGVRYEGYIGDSAKTFAVGKVSKAAQNLLNVCEESLRLGIQAAKPGSRVSDIARAIQTYVEKNGYSVVRDYTGHGIGTEMHEDPQVPNYVGKDWLDFDMVLKSGHCIAIEPMVNMGTYRTKTIRREGWDVVLTKDNKWSAHFEHSVALSENGPIILTSPEDDNENT
ncbi:MAG: type I methionyl aminopeptidase [Candidatus Brocadiae bacterium]|nr:type I methionyl aminopeptidase [Candidatus Brocadiia bacterium]